MSQMPSATLLLFETTTIPIMKKTPYFLRLVVTFIILLVGEIMPKLYANRQQLKTITIMTGPLTVLSKILKPLSMLLIKSTSIISDKINKNDQISIDQLSKALELT